RLSRVCAPAGEEIMPGQFVGEGNPPREDLTTVGQESHHRALARFLLPNSALFHHRAGMVGHIFHFQAEQIDPTQHGVNTHREERQVTEVAGIRYKLFDGLNVTWTEWGFLTDRF